MLAEEDKKDFKNLNICRLCEKNNESEKIRDPCQLTGKYREPAHQLITFLKQRFYSNKVISFHSNYTFLVIMTAINFSKS